MNEILYFAKLLHVILPKEMYISVNLDLYKDRNFMFSMRIILRIHR
jgi:hypothetical protein